MRILLPAHPVSRPVAALLVLTLVALVWPVSARVAEARGTGEKQARTAAEPKPDGPLLISISIARQTLEVYDGNRRIAASPISSGQRGFPTPKGVFTILQKNRIHFSNLYDSAPMPFMQRLTWSGVALHAGHLPGYPASHGCIRLPYTFARSLFGITRVGARVVVTHEAATPEPIRHAALLKPLPPGDPATDGATPRERTASGPTQVSSLLGVTAAAAATEPAMIPGQRTRASVAAERAAQIALLGQGLEATRGRHAEIAERLAAADREATAALADLAEAKKERDQLLAAAASWERTRESAERELEQLLRGLERKSQRAPDGLLPDALMASAGASEEQIETRIMTAIDEANVARYAATDTEPAIAERTDALAEATRRRDAVKVELVAAQRAIIEADTALKDAKRADARRDQPITVVISRKTGKLHVRQGFDDVLNAPVGIAAGEHPLGTHVLLATGYNADQTDLVWSGLTAARSAPRAVASDGARSSGRRATAEPVPPAGRAPPQTIAAALERIEIAPEVRERLAELVKPGSTLIVTDEGLGNETGKFTDLIVQTR